jgi:hypothetical protein
MEHRGSSQYSQESAINYEDSHFPHHRVLLFLLGLNITEYSVFKNRESNTLEVANCVKHNFIDIFS